MNAVQTAPALQILSAVSTFFQTTPAIQMLSGGGCPWQARKNRLTSAAEKQDDSGVHHGTAANGKRDVFVAVAPSIRITFEKVRA